MFVYCLTTKDVALVDSRCNKLLIMSFVCVENDDGVSQLTDAKAFFDARIDIRKLAQFLSCQQFSPSKVICSQYILNNFDYIYISSCVVQFSRLY